MVMSARNGLVAQVAQVARIEPGARSDQNPWSRAWRFFVI